MHSNVIWENLLDSLHVYSLDRRFYKALIRRRFRNLVTRWIPTQFHIPLRHKNPLSAFVNEFCSLVILCHVSWKSSKFKKKLITTAKVSLINKNWMHMAMNWLRANLKRKLFNVSLVKTIKQVRNQIMEHFLNWNVFGIQFQLREQLSWVLTQDNIFRGWFPVQNETAITLPQGVPHSRDEAKCAFIWFLYDCLWFFLKVFLLCWFRKANSETEGTWQVVYFKKELT